MNSLIQSNAFLTKVWLADMVIRGNQVVMSLSPRILYNFGRVFFSRHSSKEKRPSMTLKGWAGLCTSPAFYVNDQAYPDQPLQIFSRLLPPFYHHITGYITGAKNALCGST